MASDVVSSGTSGGLVESTAACQVAKAREDFPWFLLWLSKQVSKLKLLVPFPGPWQLSQNYQGPPQTYQDVKFLCQYQCLYTGDPCMVLSFEYMSDGGNSLVYLLDYI